MPHTAKAFIMAITTLALIAGWSPSASSSQRFTSCAQMHKVFKYGVAKDKAAQSRAVNDGMYRPSLKPSVHAASYKTLDRDKDGVMCEVPRSLRPETLRGPA